MSDADTGRTSGRETDPTARQEDEGFAPIEDLPLPGVHHEQGAAATHDDRAADLRDAGVARTAGRRDGASGASGASTSDGEYSDAPEVAQWSAADDGRDEGGTRTGADEARGGAVAAEAYDAGPSSEIGGTESAAPVYEKGDPQDLDDPGHVFDQTNGMVDALDGDSDGTAASDEHSAAER